MNSNNQVVFPPETLNKDQLSFPLPKEEKHKETVPKVLKKGCYYSPTAGRHFNMKMIRKICKKFNLEYELDQELGTVWFEKKE